MIDINFDIPENPVEKLQLDSNKNNKTTIKQHKVGLSPTSLENRSVNSQLVWAPSERMTRFYYTSLAFVYNDKFTGSQSFRYTTGSQIGVLIVDINAESDPNLESRIDANRQVGISTSTYNNSDLAITELRIKNDTMFKFNPGGTNQVGTIEHTALNLELGTYNQQSNTIAVGTLNQRSGTTDITSSGVSIDNANIQNGTFTQTTGKVANLTLSNQGKAVLSGGTINHLMLNREGDLGSMQIGGSKSSSSSGSDGGDQGFTHKGGEIKSLTLQQGTIENLTLQDSGSVIQQGGEIKSLTLQGGSLLQMGGNIENLTQTQGQETTIQGKVKTINLQGGSLRNKGNIDTLTTTQAAASTAATTQAFRSASAASSEYYITNDKDGYFSSLVINDTTLENYGTIDFLTLKEGNNSISNDGIINGLEVRGGSSSINTLDGVAYNKDTGLSNITINGGELSVDTLRVGILGKNDKGGVNVAIPRVAISGTGGSQPFSVKNIQVTYIDGDFDPTKSIDTQLQNYVTTDSQKFVKQTKIVFSTSPELEEDGLKIDAQGNVIFEVGNSLSADMTSLLIRQSMRRKMLIDTYLAEQSRRSLKNKERRTKERIERDVIGDSKAQYEADMIIYKREKQKWDKLANSKENKELITKYEKEYKAYQKALKQYEKDKAKWEKLSDKDKAKLAKSGKQAPIAPKEPTQPAILAQEPIMPIAPELHSSLESLYADAYGIKGDFFIRAFGGMGEHKLNDGTQTNSWSAGTLLGANWNLKLGNSQGNIGFYGGYEYLHNGYKRVDINAQGNTGFVGLRFSHLFAKTKLAGFYYIADINGGYTDMSLYRTINSLPYSARLGNINIGASMRLGSALYLNKGKSILFPSLGVGVEGGYMGGFEMKPTKETGKREYTQGGLATPYAVTYAQGNLNYYQELGKKFSTTIGGGFRYLLNSDVNIMSTLNGKTYSVDEATGKAAAVHLAPFFYQGTFMVNYHTDNAGNFSVGYVAVGGLLGITHNASMRWHYFF